MVKLCTVGVWCVMMPVGWGVVGCMVMYIVSSNAIHKHAQVPVGCFHTDGKHLLGSIAISRRNDIAP